MVAEGLSEAAQKYYILAPEIPVPERTFVLKQDETCGLFNLFGDIDATARPEEGLYHEGTRYLSKLSLSLAGGRPLLLSSAARRDNLLLSADLTNPDLYCDGQVVLPRGSLHIYRTALLWQGVCYGRIHVRNFTREPVEVLLGLGFGADYVDIFEVRGQQRARRGRALETRTGPGFAELAYEGLDRVLRRTRIECDPPPRRIGTAEMQFALTLEGHAEQVIALTVACESGEVSPVRATSCEAALAQAERSQKSGERFLCTVGSSHAQLNAWLERSSADLNMLLTHTPQGLYPYAGVPWFDTTFGRDGIITALECLWLAPQVARGVLRFLAATQAQEADAERDAEPGKILHEARRGEMAALKEIPFGRYYGSVDATPLFVMLAGAYWRRSGDLALIESLWPHLLAALTWMERYGDADRDGFIEYYRRSPNGLVQQGWKDSYDSVFHADGRLAEGPIALCEVQGYVYGARIDAAELAESLGYADIARQLREAARELRERFQKRFWCEEIGMYALALDGDKRPCRVRTSNAGHCVYSGIAAREHAQAIVKNLGEDICFSGWGVRTLADTESRYNPMAYHNGSIWPHDNALIAAGVGTLPDKELALRIFNAQLEASTYFDAGRLPELFCGFRRREGKPPTSYPVACSPQAWAAGAVFMMLEACLGLSIDAQGLRVTFRHPRLPAGVDTLTIRDLKVATGSVDLTLRRYPGTVGVDVERREGRVEVAVLS